ncbi:amidase [Leucobacter sp. M11]|uniref:amidase n=1 Tax=Leucobacter sp. M11 TaxID=2993565 RepID=UPI002D7E9991|nr:amidase family protein [Leucobacter sp. M11]MEB4613982.1 amidase family protein [Leucobacter sp. M11]
MSGLTQYSAVELRARLGRGELSAVEVVTAYLAELERTGTAVNALVSAHPEAALARAQELDRIGPSADLPLFGLPVAIKDTHNAKGFPTTAGSIRHDPAPASQSDAHVQRMVDAGAVIIGKSNVPEYAAGSHSVNRVFGATRNPYALDRSAGGSSGGAAAALAARHVALADGSDMGGSLRNPAAFCNVVGLRPTPGLIPNAEATNAFTPLTVIGPMGRTVADVALLLSVLAPAAQAAAATPPVTPEIAPVPLTGLRVAWAPTLGGRVPVAPEVLAALTPIVERFVELGASVTEACPPLDEAEQVFRTLRAAEFSAEWEQRLAEDPEDFNERLTGNIRDGEDLSAADAMRAQEGMTRLVRGADRFFEDYDLLLAPVTQVPAFPVEWDFPAEVAGELQRDYLGWMRSVFLLSPLGIPGISVPAGFTPEGLPVGLQLLSARGSDQRLLSIAQSFESVTRFADLSPADATPIPRP